MSNSERFRVSLHVSHPSLPAQDIAVSFALKLRYARSVGEPRMTKQGKALGGLYAQTDISFAVSDGVMSNDDVMVGEFVNQALDTLPLSALDRIVSSGGSCFFFLGVYSDANSLCDFDAKILSRLAKHSIGLKLDFYGGPEVFSVGQ